MDRLHRRYRTFKEYRREVAASAAAVKSGERDFRWLHLLYQISRSFLKGPMAHFSSIEILFLLKGWQHIRHFWNCNCPWAAVLTSLTHPFKLYKN
ncbi:hypothetical protein EVAR_89216_1 [Eumeta japonica]|uniref:Uncharacterized protein n=1 Tax=Eumeta variegata TaxID=151549 RepID=A0A4C2ABM8_EUMVA|nr:hypothetical protein EVAR_89216_1 [Eumeta japonica]